MAMNEKLYRYHDKCEVYMREPECWNCGETELEYKHPLMKHESKAMTIDELMGRVAVNE